MDKWYLSAGEEGYMVNLVETKWWAPIFERIGGFILDLADRIIPDKSNVDYFGPDLEHIPQKESIYDKLYYHFWRVSNGFYSKAHSVEIQRARITVPREVVLLIDPQFVSQIDSLNDDD